MYIVVAESFTSGARVAFYSVPETVPKVRIWFTGYDGVNPRTCTNTMIRFRTALSLLLIGVGLLPMACPAEEHAITIRNVRSGSAILRQQGRLTILEIKSRAGS